MAFTAVLDACALYPFSLRDSLLWIATTAPLWSAEILDEMRRNLINEYGMTEEKADRLVAKMRDAFEEAEVDSAEIDRLVPAMSNDPKDRHVLATAVAADSELVVTFNLGDFPPEACAPVGVEAIHPDSFLLDLLDLDPDAVLTALEAQVNNLTNPPISLPELLDHLENGGLPQFAQAVRDRIAALA